MISNSPQPVLDKHNEKLKIHWWEKIKALILGQWLQTKKQPNPSEEIMDFDTKTQHRFTVHEWIQAIDVLALLVQSVRKGVEFKNANEIDLELLGTSTYLFHIDRVLAKIRENFHNIRFSQEQFGDSLYLTTKHEFKQIRQLGERCHQTVLQLTMLIQVLPLKKLYSDEFVRHVHTLELDSAALSSAIRTLNQNAYKTQAMLQLASLEQDLLQSLSQSRHSFHGSQFNALQHGPMYSNEGYLRTKLQLITDPQNYAFMNGIIEIHQMLKKSYVVARKSAIKEALEKMSQHIESLIHVFSQKDPIENQVSYHLDQLFHGMESLRFSSNHDSRCSKNLFDKTKIAYFQMRKLCQKNPFGMEYLKKYSIKRLKLQSPPKG
ncbi:MAG: hypothetical protein JSS07_07565 [Proteobacteria bacterium]|nr:hypothetical protein [Pseudomonadota bacterium]